MNERLARESFESGSEDPNASAFTRDSSTPGTSNTEDLEKPFSIEGAFASLLLMKQTLCRVLLGATLITQAYGAELSLEPVDSPVDTAPMGFSPMIGGEGASGKWRVIVDALPPAMELISPLARNTNRKKVIGQFSNALGTSRVPMLIFDKEAFDDFELTTQVKVVDGQQSQTIGLVFRWQDPENYYSFRIDTLGGWYYFRKVVNGQAQEPMGNRIDLPSGQWHTLQIKCKGQEISLSLNQTNTIPTLIDTQFGSGKLGFFTEADATGYFGDTKINYRPKIAPAQRIIDQVMEKYGRLIQVSIFANETNDAPPSIIASNFKQRIGTPADEAVLDCINRGKIYYAKTKQTAIVTLPLKDRNGEPTAACRVELKKFRGQTQKNAIARAQPVAQMIAARVLYKRDLFE